MENASENATYTASQLQQQIGKVLNEVQEMGWVQISNRSRPDMVLMTKKMFIEFMTASEVSGAANMQASMKAK